MRQGGQVGGLGALPPWVPVLATDSPTPLRWVSSVAEVTGLLPGT